ncbi:Uncharacterized protein FKW44_006923 [Caligus rogercresseyi]|uniref:Uncharacterized protein n=1 Tax=Caligus rogercresseyi TaxID=217165 RepID=A0A7T8KE54_CALRO|nr:Uncharacterized protein FKW44_006923 [Caligus rogercresseyi]
MNGTSLGTLKRIFPDSGASANLMRKQDAERLGLDISNFKTQWDSSQQRTISASTSSAKSLCKLSFMISGPQSRSRFPANTEAHSSASRHPSS